MTDNNEFSKPDCSPEDRQAIIEYWASLDPGLDNQRIYQVLRLALRHHWTIETAEAYANRQQKASEDQLAGWNRARRRRVPGGGRHR